MTGIKLTTNIASLKAQRSLAENTASLGRSLERLSSGLRINRASDDAAGLAISAKLNVDTRLHGQAMRNVNDAISATNIAQGAMSSFQAISIRMRELATQAANGTFSLKQRQSMQNELSALVKEYNRISATTTFNGIRLVDPSTGSINIQVGIHGDSNLAVGLSNDLSRNISDGTYTSSSAGSTGVGSAVADLNGDGWVDIISSAGGNVRIHKGSASGFSAATSYAIGGTARDIEVVDINGDGLKDIATGDYANNSVRVILQRSDGTFNAAVVTALGSTAYGLESGDFNRDGKTDLVATRTTGTTLAILLGNGDGTFSEAASLGLSVAPLDVTTADFNGDGITDIASCASTGGDVFLGKGDGTFAKSATISGGWNYSITAGDVNQDGRSDLFLSGTNGPTHYARVSLGKGDGTFAASSTYITGVNPYNVKLADLNGDGFLDIATANLGDNVSVLYNNGDGTMAAAVNFAVGTDPYQVYAADVNRDGVLDLLANNASGASFSVLTSGTTAVSSIAMMNITTVAGAREAMNTIDTNIQRVSKSLGSLGAMQSRLDIIAKGIAEIRDKGREAEGRIMDADVATESAETVKRQILTQVASMILAQANLEPKIALSLLS